MALAYTYPDQYLRAQVTTEREARAIADVADLGAVPATWTPKLIVLRAYVIACLECQQRADDLFATKLATYRKEFDATLSLARAAQASAAAQAGGAQSGGGSFFGVDLFRA